MYSRKMRKRLIVSIHKCFLIFSTTAKTLLFPLPIHLVVLLSFVSSIFLYMLLFVNYTLIKSSFALLLLYF